jgi:hypothetical protein
MERMSREIPWMRRLLGWEGLRGGCLAEDFVWWLVMDVVSFG